jgi:hypothetical protein
MEKTERKKKISNMFQVNNFPTPTNNNDGRGVVFVNFYYPYDATGNTIIVGVDDFNAALYKVISKKKKKKKNTNSVTCY